MLLSASDIGTSAHSVSPQITVPTFTMSTNEKTLHVLDMGATLHCTLYLNQMDNVHTVPDLHITVANQSTMMANLVGTMNVVVTNEQG